MEMLLAFTTYGGKKRIVKTDDVAYRYPSTIGINSEFITLCDGRFFRAENVTEIMIDGISPITEAEYSNYRA